MSESTPIETASQGTPPRRTSEGFGRLVVFVYGLLALAATARALSQIATRFDEAPLAYLLSLFSGLVYVLATVALARSVGRWRTVAWVAITVELVGVIAVGAVSLAFPEDFPDETVWSQFGAGYGYVPLVLPVVGLVLLWRTRGSGRTH
jgi:cytochrome bd-type quinol oxidase subunit 2